MATAIAAVCVLQPIPIRQQRLAARLIQSIPSVARAGGLGVMAGV